MKIGDYEIQVPFVTTSSETTKDIVRFAGLKPGQRVCDLGSGDGRVVLELAKAGLIVHGFEIKPELVKRSRERILDAHLQEYITITQDDFWTTDLSLFEVVYVYGMTTIMARLEKRLEEALMPGTKIITNVFRLPTWRSKKEAGDLHLYIKQ